MSIENGEQWLRLVLLASLGISCIGIFVYAALRWPVLATGTLAVAAVVVFGVIDRLDRDKANRRFAVRRSTTTVGRLIERIPRLMQRH